MGAIVRLRLPGDANYAYWRLFLDAIGIEYEFQLPVLLVQNGGPP